MNLAGVILTRADTEQKFPLGIVFTAHDGKKYKYLQYASGAGAVAGTAGNVAYYNGVLGDATKATCDLSDSCSIGAGVLQATLADGEYGWFQIKGKATITPALTAGADGNALTPTGAGDGTLDVSALVTDSICAYAMDASAKIIMCDFPE